jgi:hypothetical protein
MGGRRRKRIWRAAGQSGIGHGTMTSSPLRRLQELAPLGPAAASTLKVYPACSRCAWHAGQVQRQHPTQRGMLTFSRLSP